MEMVDKYPFITPTSRHEMEVIIAYAGFYVVFLQCLQSSIGHAEFCNGQPRDTTFS